MLTMLMMHVMFVVAQDADNPAPQFLYRDGGRLVMVNGYTYETYRLPIEVREGDRFEWLPDGDVLLAKQQQSEHQRLDCINLYDVDAGLWLYEEPIACDVETTLVHPDSQHISYTTTDLEYTQATLWIFDRSTGDSQELYRKVTEISVQGAGISNLKWSPTGAYLTFNPYQMIMGGSVNSFTVYNVETQTSITVSAPNAYYGSYYPVWSQDDSWMLMILKEEYVTSGTVPHTNHRGDVYLLNSDTGEQYRLTYTPTIPETNLRWTETGDIAYTEVIAQSHTLTIEDAMGIEPVPPDAINVPEDYNLEQSVTNSNNSFYLSPDPELGVRLDDLGNAEGREVKLQFTWIYGNADGFVVHMEDPENFALIGWRPSNYSYPRG